MTLADGCRAYANWCCACRDDGADDRGHPGRARKPTSPCLLGASPSLEKNVWLACKVKRTQGL